MFLLTYKKVLIQRWITWMRIFPRQMNGVLSSVMKKQPMKKSPRPLLKNCGSRHTNVRPVRHLVCLFVSVRVDNCFEHSLPELQARTQRAAPGDAGPASILWAEKLSPCEESVCCGHLRHFCPSECKSGSDTWRRCRRPYTEPQTRQTRWPASDCETRQWGFNEYMCRFGSLICHYLCVIKTFVWKDSYIT